MRIEQYRKLSKVVLGQAPADLVLTNARIVDVFTGEIVESSVGITDGLFAGVSKQYHGREEIDLDGAYVAPGLIDAHLHLESTMVTPAELVAVAAAHGTTTFIVDPHEAANVAGADGIDYILDQTQRSTANVFVMMPSCVPATPIDDNGCLFAVEDMYPYARNPRILGLGEVMDAQSVLSAAPAMFAKLDLFADRTIDGHAPYLDNRELSAYKMAGIDTDHEATTFEYALEEVRRGIHVHIREGSAARNLDSIVSGIVREGIATENFSFCTDDKHIEDILAEGHIDHNVRRSIELGLDPIAAIRMATINTARCYGLKRLGAIAPGCQADFIVFDDLHDFHVLATYHKGRRVPTDGPIRRPACPAKLKRTMHVDPVAASDFALPIRSSEMHAIGMVPGQITTRDLKLELPRCEDFEPQEARRHSGTQGADGSGTNDEQNGRLADRLLKIAAVERHHNTGKIGVALAQGYGIRNGAVASSVSHDSHNIIVIGDNSRDMALAVNEIIRVQGGYVLVEDGKVWETLPLPIMGLMSDAGFEQVNATLTRMTAKAHEMGVPEGISPFTTLSFMALPVIPELRITPRGLCRVDDAGPHLLG